MGCLYEGAKPPSLVSEESQPSARARIEGPYGPEILVSYTVCCPIVPSWVCHIMSVVQLYQAVYAIYRPSINCAKLFITYTVCCSIVKSFVPHLLSVVELCQALYPIYCLLFNYMRLCILYTVCC